MLIEIEKKMAVSVWWIVLVVMCFRVQRLILVSMDSYGVVRSFLLEQYLFMCSHEEFRSPRVVLLNWKTHPFYLKLLLSLSGDVHLNPGPPVLCGVCESSVSDEDKAVCCDGCDKWIHVSCDSTICEQEYNYMVLNPFNKPWFCALCCLNISNSPPNVLVSNPTPNLLRVPLPAGVSMLAVLSTRVLICLPSCQR